MIVHGCNYLNHKVGLVDKCELAKGASLEMLYIMRYVLFVVL